MYRPSICTERSQSHMQKRVHVRTFASIKARHVQKAQACMHARTLPASPSPSTGDPERTVSCAVLEEEAGEKQPQYGDSQKTFISGSPASGCIGSSSGGMW